MKKIALFLVVFFGILNTSYAELVSNSVKCNGAIWNNCLGTYTYSSGDIYSGEWKNNLAHGKGVYTWITGEKYSGGWQRDEFNGIGTYSNLDGTFQYGIWINGKYISQPSFTMELSGECEVGSWKSKEFTNGSCVKLPAHCVSSATKINTAYCGVITTDKELSQTVLKNDSTPEVKFKTEEVGCSGNNLKVYDKCFGEWKFEANHPNWPDATYTGEWKNGKPNGNGTAVYPNGHKYVGKFKNGMAHGYGVMTGDKGEKYSGQWINDKLSGQGTQTFSDGSIYIGQFKNDKFHGKGTATKPDGQKQIGKFINGDFINGTITFPSGSIYEGIFADNNMINGTVTFPSGNIQKGEFNKDGELVKGTISFASGNVYEGIFVDEIFVNGTVTFISGNIAKGEFDKDGYLLNGTVTFPSGNVQKGQFNKDSELINGVMVNPDGTTYSGKFTNSELTNGTVDFPSGNRYEGELKNHKYNGQGKLTLADGSVYEGEFKDGAFIKPKDEVKEKVARDDEIIPAASGSGFAITSDGYVITNYHVIEGCSGIEIYENNQPISAKVINFDLNNDIALLKADFNPIHYFPLRRANPELLMEIYAAGYPFGYDISTPVKVTRGIISSLSGVGNNYSNIQTDAAIQPGNSGGPIVDKKGNVVAVAVASLSQEEVLDTYGVLPEGTHFGIKSNVVVNFLESNNINLLNPNSKEISGGLLGRMITDGTYYISCLMTMAQINELKERKAMFTNLN